MLTKTFLTNNTKFIVYQSQILGYQYYLLKKNFKT